EFDAFLFQEAQAVQVFRIFLLLHLRNGLPGQILRLTVALDPTLVTIYDLSLGDLLARELKSGRTLVSAGHLPGVFKGERQIGLAGDQVGRSLDLDPHRPKFGDLCFPALGLDSLLDDGPCPVLGRGDRRGYEQATKYERDVYLLHRVLPTIGRVGGRGGRAPADDPAKDEDDNRRGAWRRSASQSANSQPGPLAHAPCAWLVLPPSGGE